MPQSHYLLFIDHEPVSAELKEYFASRDLDIKQQKKLQLPVGKNLPIALLISWSLLETKPEMIYEFYNKYPIPIVIIQDIFNEANCIQMLEAGADDCLSKPLHPRELYARIHAIARRIRQSGHSTEPNKESFHFANLRLCPASRQVFNVNNQEVSLSVSEYNLLFLFVQQPQKILDREYLLQMTKNSALNPFDRRIDIQISRLRQKIEGDPAKPILIRTVRNGGYVFTAQVTRS